MWLWVNIGWCATSGKNSLSIRILRYLDHTQITATKLCYTVSFQLFLFSEFTHEGSEDLSLHSPTHTHTCHCQSGAAWSVKVSKTAASCNFSTLPSCFRNPFPNMILSNHLIWVTIIRCASMSAAKRTSLFNPPSLYLSACHSQKKTPSNHHSTIKPPFNHQLLQLSFQ